MQGNFLLRHRVAAGQMMELLQFGAGQERHVHDRAATGAGEVPVFGVVCAITRGPAVQMHFADQTALGQRLEDIVDRGQLEGFHLGLGPKKDFHGRRVVLPLEQCTVNMLALAGQTQAILRDRLLIALELFFGTGSLGGHQNLQSRSKSKLFQE